MLSTKQNEFSLKILTLSLFTLMGFSSLALIGCATTPIGSTQSASQQALHHSVLQAHDTLMSRQSYAYDFKMQLQKQPLLLTSKPLQTPKRDQLINQLITQHQLSAEQRALLEKAVQNQRYEDIGFTQGVKAVGQNLYWKGSGVMELGVGKFSVVPEFGYQGNNAQGYVKLPMAVDLLKSKAYVNMSMLSTFVTDPKYNGRYVEFDYGKLLKDSQVNAKPLVTLIKEFSLLMPTLASDSDYVSLPLSAQDTEQNIARRIGYKHNYQKMITDYLLYIYLNEQAISRMKVDKENAMDFARHPIRNTFKKMEVAPPVTIDRQAMLAAERMYSALNHSNDDYQENDATITTTTEETLDAQQGATVDAFKDPITDAETREAVENANQSAMLASQSAEGVVDGLDSESDILKKFDKYKSDNVLTAKQLQKIINDNPDSYAKLLELTQEKFGGMLGASTNADINYLFNKNNQLVRIESISPMPDFSESNEKNTNAKIESVMNFYNYGTAKVDRNIFANAVTFKEATKEDSFLAVENKKGDFDESKNRTDLAKSLLKQGKSDVEAFTSLYVSQYLLDNDEQTLQNIDLTALQKTAKQLADAYVEYKTQNNESDDFNDSLSEEWQEDTYFSAYLARYVSEALNEAKDEQKYLNLIKQQRALGVSEADIFSQLYYMLTVEAQAGTGYDNEDEDAQAETVFISQEQQACETLLDSEELDKKSYTKIEAICQKLEKQNQVAVEQAQIEEMQIKESQALAQAEFAQVLGKVAIEDMQSHKTADEDGDNKLDSRLLKKLQPYSESFDNFSESAYRKAYRLMLTK